MKLVANKVRPIGRNLLEYRNSKGEFIFWCTYREFFLEKKHVNFKPIK